ncbi:hypothetical protein [Cohnella boryungensis]|uniref:Fibronectin type-III domain-containing protein n=1 Tax=Cohnella boryungensis TaxID=768479 RepID=A0ABV8SCI9_9BACL
MNGAVTGLSKTITVKSAGTYNFTVYPNNSSGNGAGSSKAFTVDTPVPNAPTIEARIEGGFQVSWNSIPNVTMYQLEYKPHVNSVWNTLTTSASTASLSLGQWGLDYDLRVRASLNAGSTYGNWSSTTIALTNPKKPTLSGVYNSGSSTVTLTVGGLSGSDSRFDIVLVEMKRRSDNALIETKSTTVNGGQVQFAQYTSSQIKLYYFRAYSRKESLYGAGTVYSLGYSEEVAFSRPNNFSWSHAGIHPVTNAIVSGPLKIQGYGFYATAAEWNSLISRVLEFREYKGLGGFSYNSAVQGEPPRAAQFKQVRNAIAAMNSSGLPAEKNAGDPITAADFNALVSCLNAIN